MTDIILSFFRQVFITACVMALMFASAVVLHSVREHAPLYAPAQCDATGFNCR
jgi:hypothetical protein